MKHKSIVNETQRALIRSHIVIAFLFTIACFLGATRLGQAQMSANGMNATALEDANIPPSWDNRLIYYQNFQNSNGTPAYNSANLRSSGVISPMKGGLFGECGKPDEVINLQGEALSPSHPLTISFWWSLNTLPNNQSGFNLVSLTGQGLISNFVRSGPWCGLTQPAAVCQIYYFKGIKDVNGVYNTTILKSLDLKPGIWHHTLLTIIAASKVEVWTDGTKVFETRTVGRDFRGTDHVTNLQIGDNGPLGMSLAEVVILNRPLAPKEITDYYIAVRQMTEAHER